VADGTIAVPTSLLVNDSGGRRALCPGCQGGRLQPFKVQLDLGGFEGYRYADGWVAVCAGSRPDLHESDELAVPCGFAMPITPRRGAWPDVTAIKEHGRVPYEDGLIQRPDVKGNAR
jgi:hypothetical protein